MGAGETWSDQAPKKQADRVCGYVNLSGKRAVSGHDSEKPVMAPKEQTLAQYAGMNLSGCETEEDDTGFVIFLFLFESRWAVPDFGRIQL